ncbi:HEPN domain-containing protein [Acinetobacter baumannii]|nr:HEPN domain-containing protein [Acinetobacter baumannii]
MAINLSKRDKLTRLILECVEEIFPILISKIHSNKYISNYSDFPKLSFAENGFPRISKDSWSGNRPKDFTSLFHRYGDKAPEIDWDDILKFKDLYDLIREDDELLNYFGSGLNLQDSSIDFDKTSVQLLIGNILDYYIHTFGYDFDKERFLTIIELRTNFAFLEKLPINIYIPILFLNFEIEKYDLADGISIRKLSELLHLSRVEAKSTNVLVHDCVLEGATHALVIENYYINNKSRDSYECLYYKEAYPTDLVHNFFSALRLITDCKTGYAQIFAEPENWTTRFREKLLNIRGCSVREFPHEFEFNQYWMNNSFPIVNVDQLNIIKDFYGKLSSNKHKSIPIALKRLNSCMLRHDEEDTVLDATIALEVLLSDDGKTEMTHKLALRVAALSKLDSNCKEKPKEVFAKIKKVYTYRSGIVHGTKDLSKSKVIKIPESSELKTVDVAIEMLKMVLRVLLCNDKYFDAKSIDEDLLLNN